MLTKRTEEQIEVLPNGIIQSRIATIIEEDGVFISKSYHRHVVDVEDDLTEQSDRVKAIAASVWTDEVKAARKAVKDEQAKSVA